MVATELRPLPHREAIAYLQSKGFAPPDSRFDYRDVWLEEHARNWVVAKAMRDDVSRTIREAVTRMLSEGQTLRSATEELAPRLRQMGWWGRQAMTDPLTGETRQVQLGSMRRLRVIFDTNMRTAHAAGHWAAIQRTKKAFPYLHYIQIDRPTKRHDHIRFHDKIWRVDDPVWLRIYPPNGYFCGCHVIQRTEGWMRRHGRTVDPPADLDERAWLNERTGETTKVPRGIDPGFDANPGAAWLNSREPWSRATPDLSAERRATELGIVEALRLQTLARQTEAMVILGPGGEPRDAAFADPADPARVRFARRDVPVGATILHSHLTDTPLSTEDLAELFAGALHSVVAVAPGGSIWRATRTPGQTVRLLIAEFSQRVSSFRTELAATPDAQVLYLHALALWLEKRGAIAYRYGVSERVRQQLDRNADLVRRMVDGIAAS